MRVKLQTYVFGRNVLKQNVKIDNSVQLPKLGTWISEVPLGKNHFRYNDFIFTSRKLGFESKLTINNIEEIEMELCKLN